MRKSLLVLAAVALLAPVASRAEEGAPMFKVGLSLGYSMPYGDAQKGESMSNVYSGEIPIELELTYKLTHSFGLGVYAGYGYGIITPSGRVAEGVAASGVIGSAATYRFGVQGEWEFGKMGAAMPFIGARIGYVTENLTGKNDWPNSSASGWEWLTLVGGADFEVSKSFTAGPFASAAIGTYTTAKPPGGSSESIPDAEQTLHGWLTVGVRGTFGF